MTIDDNGPPMNLQPISSATTRPFRFVCIRCACACQSDRDADARADLNGEPFAAYYCGPCVRELRKLELTRAARYRGAHVVDAGGRLATIWDVYLHPTDAAVMTKLRRFNGDDAGAQELATLDVLVREYDPPGDDDVRDRHYPRQRGELGDEKDRS